MLGLFPRLEKTIEFMTLDNGAVNRETTIEEIKHKLLVPKCRANKEQRAKEKETDLLVQLIVHHMKGQGLVMRAACAY